MKKIIKIKEIYGQELHTRQTIERMAASFLPEDSYLLDMQGVEQISRSAADELYNLTHGSSRVDLVNLEPFVEKMLSAVTIGRFLPRVHTPSNTPIIHCNTISSVIRHLESK